MIYLKEGDTLPTPYQACDVMNQHALRGGVFFDLDRILDYQSHIIERARKPLRAWRNMANEPYLNVTENNRIADLLVGKFHVPITKLHKLNSDKLSIAAEVIDSLVTDPDSSEATVEFLKLFQGLKKYQHGLSYLGQYAELPLCAQNTFDNHRMVLAKPHFEVLSTGRISAAEPSVQNIDHQFSDIITYPAHYQLVRADSGQIEPRIMYSYYVLDTLIKDLIILYDDAYLGLYHYIQLPTDQIHQYNAGDVFPLKKLEINDEVIAGRKKLKLLALAGNYGKADLTMIDPVLGPMYADKVVGNSARLDWEARVRKEVYLGATTCHEAFGFEITPEDKNGKYEPGTKAWTNHLIRCFINNPVQGTASRLMCKSVIEADEIICTKASEKTFIGYYKHDEGAFYVYEDDYAVIPELSDITAYQVEGWIPIHCEVEKGVLYPVNNVTHA